MKWTMKLVVEVVPGESVEHEIFTIERSDEISPATVGLTIDEGKVILENLQKQICHCAGETALRQHSIVSRMRKGVSHQGLLSIHSSLRIR
jgi:hypothetical protein